MPTSIPTADDRSKRVVTYYETTAKTGNIADQLYYVKMERFLLIALSLTAAVVYFSRRKT